MSSDGSVSTSGSSSTALCLGFLLFLAGTTQAGEPAPHWAFQPLREQLPPAVQNERWIQSPVDRFILARLEALRVAPSPAAGRQQLIRRATFDLTGLAPTAAEAEAFLADTSPRAFQTVVDRLLNSPRYGERWGRWWLDIARYADSNGQDENKFMANAWRYRDWVIRSFERDIPFDQFVLQQIAGDLLPREGVSEQDVFDRWTATGFLVLGPKMLAEQDKPKLVMDLVDEQLDTIGRAFLGLTVSCARCHDHKFDPISTRDYYALAGILKSTRSMENLSFVSKWNERSIATREHRDLLTRFRQRTNEIGLALTATIREANQAVENAGLAGAGKTNAPSAAALPADRRPLWSAQHLAAVSRLEAERASLLSNAPPAEPFAPSADEGSVTNLPVHLRGSHLTLAKEAVPRGFIQVLGVSYADPIPERQSGRLELARWLVNPQHPLLARVTVNRLWQAHFGEGLVRTSDNFGVKGESPSHPELLDWLAAELIRSGWSVKAMHRKLMLSAVYQQSSAAPERAAGGHEVRLDVLDPDNRLLSRFPRQRLEAEMIRDALLQVAGQLDFTVGGSLAPWKNDEYVPGDEEPFRSQRRSVYLPIVRDRVYDVFTLFDFANPSVGTAKRGSTVVAHQALFYMNSPLVKSSAKRLAAEVLGAPRATDAERAQRLYRRVLGRLPTREEVGRAVAFLQRAGTDATASGELPHRGWSALAQVLLASNEFTYRD
jgi:hypothetical protein